jgi:hypothetical protein
MEEEKKEPSEKVANDSPRQGYWYWIFKNKDFARGGKGLNVQRQEALIEHIQGLVKTLVCLLYGIQKTNIHVNLNTSSKHESSYKGMSGSYHYHCHYYLGFAFLRQGIAIG